MTANYSDSDIKTEQAYNAWHAKVIVEAPFALILLGLLLGFAFRRKSKGEKFRTSPFVICGGVALIIFGVLRFLFPSELVIV